MWCGRVVYEERNPFKVGRGPGSGRDGLNKDVSRPKDLGVGFLGLTEESVAKTGPEGVQSYTKMLECSSPRT